MEDHAGRVVRPVLDALARYEAGIAAVGDIQASAAGAIGALDNTNADLRAALDRLESDLEMVIYATPQDQQQTAVKMAVADLRRLTADL